ncbi:MAG: pyruvate formate lyase family protein, partial [Chloroflexota bacterium]
DGKRRAELNEIAQICDWVPENPARTLREAMQSYWLVYMITRIIETHGQGAGNRLDQLMYPFYAKDVKEGSTTREQTQELVEFFLVKVEETGHLCVPEMHTGGAGVSMYQSYTMGGQTPDGKDATNEFSFIMIDAAIAMKTHHTNYILRYHPDINQDFVLRAIDLIRTGVGFPAVFNDSCIIPYLVNRGIPLQDARNYVIRGCVGWLIPGKANHVGRVNAGSMSLGKCLELALNQGKCQLTGRQLGCVTADPNTFKSIEDIMQAYLQQVRFAFDKLVKIDNIAQHFYVKHMQRPFASALIDDCIEKGRDCSAIPYHLLPSIMPTGTTNVADSLAAIKKFVFDEKRLTMEELLHVLRSNWQGKEDLRQRFINEAPKFGNDDDYADLIAREVHHRSQKVAEEFKDYYGFPWSLNGSIAGGYYPWGRRAGASADGRMDKDTFSDAVMSPSAGMDRKGPTAVIKSVSKIPATWPELCNQKFMPQFLEGDNKRIFAAYLKTWADMGNYHIQFNVVDKETLLDAQGHPEKYSNLVVRVAGYSAFFVDLTHGLQDDIIRRTAQRF